MVPQLTHKIAEVKDTEPLKQKQSRLKFQFEYKVRHLTREEQAAYWHARETPFRSGKMDRIGLDIGTKNIVLAYRKDNKLSFRREVNGFVSITKGDNFTKQMLVQAGVPYIEREKDFIAIGEKAENLAFAFGKELQRPMVDGVLSVTERQAMGIMGVIIKSIIGKINDDTTLCYCIPAHAINKEVNIEFHQKITQAILESFDVKVKLGGFPINEARAIVISRSSDRSAIGISMGAGMVNVCYCLYGVPVYEFSIVGAGDWIDKESSRATNESPTAIARIKESEEMRLDKGMPPDFVKKAIYINYMILIEKVARGIAEGFRKNESKAKAPKPMPIIVAGGTAAIGGFIELFKEVFAKQDMPFAVGEITLADRPLFAVAEGCLIASEMQT
jgi:actin-like ATPase involved in cell morphogenesis